MCVLMFVPLTFVVMLAEVVQNLITRHKARRAERSANNKRGFTMLTILCILLFPVVLLVKLLDITK